MPKITRQDLVGLENLKSLCVTNNEIVSLPSDLLVDMKNLTKMTFKDNLIAFVDSKMFEVTKDKLTVLNFEGNPSIDIFITKT